MLTRSTAAVTLSRDTRYRYGLAFDSEQAQLYHGVRPGYQSDVVEFFGARTAGLAVDLGAGTGLFTAQLIQAGWDVVAVDPAANMVRVLTEQYPQVSTAVSKVEALDTTPWAQQANLVVAAQSWHWIDTVQGSQKVAELLADNGVFGIVHHQIDTSIPWVLRLCKIMHSGDIHPVELPSEVSAAFSTPVGAWWHWEQELSVEQIHQLMMTRAYYLRTSDKQRRRMHENLRWYLLEHLGYAQSSTILLPYVTAAWRMQRSAIGHAVT